MRVLVHRSSYMYVNKYTEWVCARDRVYMCTSVRIVLYVCCMCGFVCLCIYGMVLTVRVLFLREVVDDGVA